MKKDITRNSTKNAESNKREGYHKKKVLPVLSPEQIEAVFTSRSAINKELVRIMDERGLSGVDVVRCLSPFIKYRATISRIVCGVNDPSFERKENVTLEMLVAMVYVFDLDLNEFLHNLLKRFS